MVHDERIDELVEEILDSDRTPEEVCAELPELLQQVHDRLRKVKAVAAQVDSIFPSTTARLKAIFKSESTKEVSLPTIPGYEVQAVLGRGGMGIVYKARHLKLNRVVALKMLLTGSYASPTQLLRFEREAESVAALRHANIVQVFDIGEFEGLPYFTMEYVGGGTLSERLNGVIQPARESAKVVRDLARAVQVAHDCGIVHRDLKPANILLAEGDAPTITDFGLARWLERDSGLTNTGARMGTPSYMAPEQMTGASNSAAPAVDIFSLGAILYEMLTGRPPFRGENLSDTERRLTTEEAVSPGRFNPMLPRDLVTICLKCLEKDPRSRYSSAQALADDLDRLLRHEPILARPVAPLERGVRWIRRNPFPAALAFASFLMVGLISGQAMREMAQGAADRAEKARLTSRFESGIDLADSGRFAEARAILGKLGDGGFTDLRQRIDRARSDMELAEKLEAIGIKRSMSLVAPDSTWQPHRQAAAAYEELFAQSGLGKVGDSPTTIAAHIGMSDIEPPLIAALDDWAVCEADVARRNWILQVLQHADPAGRSDWERRCRDPATWSDGETLGRLAESAISARPSVQQLRALGDRLSAASLDATAFRLRVQQQHVDDFLANLSLADAIRPTDPRESIRYYQAALAIRPASATVHNNLAVALTNLGRSEEARLQYEESLRLDPNSVASRVNLGLALAKERPQEAIQLLQQAIKLDGKLAPAHRVLGEIFLQEQRFSEAKASLQTCLSLLEDSTQREEIAELLQKHSANLLP
ncbi:Serine/threonine-protein kinase PknB [Anatilimnocola aggregata]|uniref:non-specific serine/threonine protein kinase n=1 Tax=Anatilimnocola aggregata TaxID=2528021 RepID=A0A517Y7F4_9BACT|nr:serine/threonine-protein kinase [Anatilimnocola aggregata]QDU26173.1 Serine/threonine-protein kinase PknB [Anatilimnocola aggregata]